MAKKSVMNRNAKRAKQIKQFAKKRAVLKAQACNEKLSIAERMEWHHKLQMLPRDSSKTRRRNRCRITGRGNGVFSKFGLCRIKLREYAMNGEITGLVKSSW